MNKTLIKIQKNNSIHIYSVLDNEFKKYGRVINFKSRKFLAEALRETKVPEKENIYVASKKDFETQEAMNDLYPYFGAMNIQIGYCNGNNSLLGAMEWHDCNEVNIGGTDAILFLGRIEELDDKGQFDTSKVKAFFLPKDVAVLVNAGTLHYAPCKVTEEGFKIIVALEKGTNLPLSEKAFVSITKTEDIFCKMLNMQNKYLICHKENEELIQTGVKPLVLGENFKINTIL